jgi:hypothetical protein
MCVHFTDSDDRIRWGIDEGWREAGEYTLSRVATDVAARLGPADLSIKRAVVSVLTEKVVEAAADPTMHRVLPCRTYALMLALDVPCIMIEAERATARPLTVGQIYGSPLEADEWIDELEAGIGAAAMRTTWDGDSGYEVAIPFNPAFPSVSVDDLALALPREIAEELASHYASAEFRDQLSLVLAEAEAYGQIRH